MKVSDVVKERIAPMFTGDIRLVDVDYENAMTACTLLCTLINLQAC